MDFAEASSTLARKQRLERGKAIIEQSRSSKSVRPYRVDGYINVLNKYGTSRDNSEAYEFQPEAIVPDTNLTIQYEDNGLFAKIIDTPAEEALKHGFELGLKDENLLSFVEDALDALEWEEKASTAIKWARLYGGSIIVMLIDDGRGLEEPVDWNNIRSIDELRVYERAVVQPDYTSLYSFDPMSPMENRTSKFGMPEYYYVHSLYGSFTVHESRCLIFRNGILPERVTNPVYRFWGTPEYVRIQRAMKNAITAHGNGPKLLDRSVQPIYKMKNLASTLAAEGGDEIVMKRLEVIDLARGILNSIAIDSEGEDYDFKSLTFTGVKDVIDSTCNMLSAVTNIPQTILFGRSPAGENSTGDSDFENYYNFVERIQKLMLKGNIRNLLDILFCAGLANHEISEKPKYKLEFNPLWSLSDAEQANVDKTRADTEFVKAQTAQLYVQMQALDPSEVRDALSRSEAFTVGEILDSEDDGDEDWGLSEMESLQGGSTQDQPSILEQPKNASQQTSMSNQTTFPTPTQNSDGAELKSPPRTDTMGFDEEGNWITMSGTHVLIGEEGTIVGGPPNLKGKKHQPKNGGQSGGSKEKSGAAQPNKAKAPDFVPAGAENTYKRYFDGQVKKVSHGKTLEEMDADEKRAISKTAFNWKERKPYTKEQLDSMDDEAINEVLQSHFEMMAKKQFDSAEKCFQREKSILAGGADDSFAGEGLSTSEVRSLASSTAEKMTLDEYSAFNDYKSEQDGVYRSLNQKLRNGESTFTEAEQKAKSVIEKYSEPIGAETTVYRSVNSGYLASIVGEDIAASFEKQEWNMSGYNPNQVNSQIEKIKASLVGTTQKESGFMSTGYAAVNYFTSKSDNNVLLKMNIHKDAEVFVAPSSTEGEIILKPNANYKINAVYFTESETVPTIKTDVVGKYAENIKNKIVIECEFTGYN